jgi:hypothetical protein
LEHMTQHYDSPTRLAHLRPRLLRQNRDEFMQHYLHIGGDKDGLTYPTPDGPETVTWTWPVGVKGRETYLRDSLSVGDASITFYRHESLTPEQVLNLLVEHYRAWAMNRPGGRR